MTAAHPRTSSTARPFILGSTPCAADRNRVTTLVSSVGGERERKAVQAMRTWIRLSITVPRIADPIDGHIPRARLRVGAGTTHRNA